MKIPELNPARAPESSIANSALLTDLYQLTMAYGYWRSGRAEAEGVFHLFFRNNPFKAGFTICCGLEQAIDYLRQLAFTRSDLEYLATIRGRDGAPLFNEGFLEHLGSFRFSCDVDAVPEGTVVFPHEPLIRVTGSMIEAQLIETALLNTINFQSLVATKTARICLAAQGDDVIEFGLRRAQGPDGGLSASRAAYIGGCSGTSNVLAGKTYGIPVAGTHAHSWVMAFESELEAFQAYAAAMPNNCILLVDTYDSLEGVRHAVQVGRALREQGHELSGIRLDSGDLAYLSIEARKLLDEGGFPNARIVASNDLDEHIIASLKQQGAAIQVWGVGTKLVTAFDQPALGGVYKLGAFRQPGAPWSYRLKRSEQTAKSTTPGILQVRRFNSGSEFSGDAIYDELSPIPTEFTIIHPADQTRRKIPRVTDSGEDLLVPVFRKGKLVMPPPPLTALRDRVRQQLAMLHPGIKRTVNPHEYPAGLELSLHEAKLRMLLEGRSVAKLMNPNTVGR